MAAARWGGRRLARSDQSSVCTFSTFGPPAVLSPALPGPSAAGLFTHPGRWCMHHASLFSPFPYTDVGVGGGGERPISRDARIYSKPTCPSETLLSGHLIVAVTRARTIRPAHHIPFTAEVGRDQVAQVLQKVLVGVRAGDSSGSLLTTLWTLLSVVQANFRGAFAAEHALIVGA